jgi:hypothetical protein
MMQPLVLTDEGEVNSAADALDAYAPNMPRVATSVAPTVIRRMAFT